MNSIQLELPIAQPPQPTLNLTGLVMNLMSNGAWWTPWELQRRIDSDSGEWHSDASITARIRDGRKPQYGNHLIEKRIREGSRAYEYRLIA